MVVETVPAKGNLLGSLIPARYILAILGSVGMAIVYGLKVNLSVAMVAMLNHTAIQQLGRVPIGDIVIELHQNASASSVGDVCAQVTSDSSASASLEDGPFAWSEPLQGTILSCYFWGYIVSQIPGARVAEAYSAKYVMLFSVALNVVCTLLTPLAARLSYVAMIAMRIGEGIGGGVTFPAMHVMLAAWAPPAERSTLSAIVYAGTSLGTVASMLAAGLLAAALGWESVFYVMGGLSVAWMVLWWWLVQDRPALQPLISAEERQYIEASLSGGGGATAAAGRGEGAVEEEEQEVQEEKPKLRTPWRAIATSAPFWAILIAHTCSNWGWYMLLIELPFYMKQVLQFNIRENALATALPFLTMWLFSMALSRTLDALRQRGRLSTTTARKVGTLCASAVPAVSMLALCYVDCTQRGLAVVLMGVAVTSIGGMFSGFLSNHIDVAPRLAGTLMACTNTVATVPGIVVPIFVGAVTQGNQTIEAWRLIFFVTIGLYAVEMVTYTWLGSGEEQSWNRATGADGNDDDEAGKASTAEATPLNSGEDGTRKLGPYTEETKI